MRRGVGGSGVNCEEKRRSADPFHVVKGRGLGMLEKPVKIQSRDLTFIAD